MSAHPHPPFPRPLHARLLSSFSTLVRIFVVLVLIGWILSAGNLHDISRQQPDADHSFPVHEHGSIFYIRPALGKIYVNLPWLLGGSLVFAVLMDYLPKKQLRLRS